MTERGHSKSAIMGASALSTFIYVSALTPFDVVKNFSIASFPPRTSLESFRHIISENKVRGLWRGFFPGIVSNATSNMVYYPIYESARPWADKHFGSLGSGVAGVLARAASVAVSSPAERIKTSVQGTGAATIVFNWKAFTGLQATLYRDIMFSGAFFLIMENLYKKLSEQEVVGARIISSLVGGSVAVLLTNPFDVLKTKIQTQYCCFEDYENKPFKGMKSIAKNEGWRGLFWGVGPRLSKLVSGLVIYINTYEYFKSKLSFS